MSRALVDQIIGKIESLDDQDRLDLECKLARRLETEWRVATTEARRVARRRGINQAAIDQAIQRRRYGR